MKGLESRLFGLAAVMLALATSTVAHAQTFSVLYNFGSQNGDPVNPLHQGIVAQGRDGNLYSTAYGGTNNEGAVFKITPGGTLTVLYSFDGTHGLQPQSGLTLGSDGNFYGTTSSGGTSNYGTVFKVTPNGSLSVLYNFTSGYDGADPAAPPIEGTDGNFYGTTVSSQVSYGSVYKITPSGKFTTLYDFGSTEGAYPYAPLVQGTDGTFYGTTGGGGAHGFGVVFKITPSGKLAVLHNFDGADGQDSDSPLVQGSDGNFYSTTYGGGKYGTGVVYRITSTGRFAVLHNMNGTAGGYSAAGLVQATDGNLYGVDGAGGAKNDGAIFSISPTKPYPHKDLHNFNGTMGATPWSPLLQHTNGILYGDTEFGGTGGGNGYSCNIGECGVFYSLNVGLESFVSLVSTSGKVGKVIGILGQGFTSSSVVKFGGVQATSVKNTGTTFLSVTVPSVALTGSVTVTTGSTILTSNKTFRVTPQILSFSPTSGPVGTPVTISGASLSQTTKVTFGGVKATQFTVNSDTQVTAYVPTGAKTGHIIITTLGGAARSSGIFTVTQ